MTDHQKQNKGLTPEQINAKGGKRGLERFGEVREVDTEARTVELAFSSEVPVARWFGEEVLDHSPGAMRVERLEQGAALLINHDWDDQVGVVEAVSIGEDRRGRAVVRFGRSARANEIWQDVVDGIRKHVSVGYSVRKIEVEPRKGQPDLVRVTEWEPFEISLVSVPADPTVGVGRAAEIAPEEQPGQAANTDGNHRNKEPEKMDSETEKQAPAAPVIDAKAERAKGSDAERARVRSIMEMGEKYGAEDLAGEAVKDGAKPEEFQRKLLDHLNGKRGGTGLGEATDAEIGMTDKEAGEFSFVRALRALANPTDKRAQEAARFEFEASHAAAQRMGKTPEGILVPADVLRRTLNTATSGSAAGDTGGFSVATDLLAQSFIDLLRNRTVAMQLGTTMGGLVGNIQIPRQASGASGYWIGEDQDAPKDGLELDQIGMSPKTVAALSEITRRLLLQSSLDVEALVRRDLATALALTIDKAFFYGSGSSNEPRGVVNYSGINAVDFGTTGKPTFGELVEMESEIAADNADVSSMAYVINAKMRGHMKTATKFGTGTDGTIWEAGNTVNGYRTEVTNQINAGDVIFGNYADAMIGMWGGLELNVDPYTHSAKGRLRVVAFQDVDFVLRRVESFCLGRKP
jgi:HK97 family phage major capsid protein/HK97 family phage prohead protease